jgi:Mg2+/Co2+ transporter CorB
MVSSLVVVELGVILALVAVSAFFSSSETALFSLDADWPGTDADGESAGDGPIGDESTGTEPDGDGRAARLAALREDPHRLLVTLLVGNNVVNIAITSIITVVVTRYVSAGVGVLVTTLSASVLILVFGEIVPKSYGLGHAREWSLTVAGPLRIVELALLPLVVVFDRVTRWIGGLIGGDEDIEEPYVD